MPGLGQPVAAQLTPTTSAPQPLPLSRQSRNGPALSSPPPVPTAAPLDVPRPFAIHIPHCCRLAWPPSIRPPRPPLDIGLQPHMPNVRPVIPHLGLFLASFAFPFLPNPVLALRPTLPGLGHPVDMLFPPVASALCQTFLPRCPRKLPATPSQSPSVARNHGPRLSAHNMWHDYFPAEPHFWQRTLGPSLGFP